jgi:hypothetical protein
MGTRSLTVVVDKSWDRTEEICVLYRQCDGYPTGHGQELKEFLAGMRIVNGINSTVRGTKFANGVPCLAAQLVAHFKTDREGGFYLHPAGTRGCGSEYLYVISGKFGDAEPHLEVFGRSETPLYSGPASHFNPKAAEAA